MVWNHHRSFYPHLIWKNRVRPASSALQHIALPWRYGLDRPKGQGAGKRFASQVVFLGASKYNTFPAAGGSSPRKHGETPKLDLVGGFKFQPIWKNITSSKLEIFPQVYKGENEKCLSCHQLVDGFRGRYFSFSIWRFQAVRSGVRGGCR